MPLSPKHSDALEMLRQIAIELSKIDNVLWEAIIEPGESRYAFIKCSESEKGIYVYLDDMLSFTGWTPEYLRPFRGYDHQNVTINASASRSPVSIAKDIARRLLPDYRAQIDAMIQSKALHDDYNARQGRLNRRLVAAFGSAEDASRLEEIELFYRHNYPRGYATCIKAQSSIYQHDNVVEQASLRFEHISPELAEELLRVASAFLTREG